MTHAEAQRRREEFARGDAETGRFGLSASVVDKSFWRASRAKMFNGFTESISFFFSTSPRLRVMLFNLCGSAALRESIFFDSSPHTAGEVS
jgi:hypothetical protein